MKAKALICDKDQKFALEDVVLSDPGPEDIVIRNLYSGVSVGTEFALVRGKLSWGPYPLCTGYQGVGVVEQAGKDVKGAKVGDKVYFRGNTSMKLADGTSVSGVSGTHCSMVITRVGGSHGAALKPEGAPDDCASMFVMPAVGLFGVDMASPGLGDVVVVYGAGLIGLGVVNACALRGCVVIAVDILDNRLEVARKLGADYVVNGKTQDVGAEVRKVAPNGADAVFESTGIPQCVKPAIELCRGTGTFVWQGNYGAAAFPFEFLPAHGRKLTMYFPCDDGLPPCRRAVIKNMASGALPWHEAISHRVEPKDASALFDRINKNKADDVVGAVIHWS